MEKIGQEVRKGKILVSDGAWGTFLQQKGLKPGECAELWNIERRSDVLEIAGSYIAAGADMIETNSFGGNAFKLGLYGLSGRVRELNVAAANLSREAAGEKFVLGSIGPTGKILMLGDVSEEELYEAFKAQAIALEEGGADALIIETMSDLDETRIAIAACKENVSCEVICTMTFEKTGEGSYHTMMGVTPAQMTQDLVGYGADIIGANCGNGIADMIGITEEIRSVNSDVPILIHANAGAPIFEDGETRFRESPQQMAGFVQSLIAAGANIIGGCCGTTPEHIRMIAGEVRKQGR